MKSHAMRIILALMLIALGAGCALAPAPAQSSGEAAKPSGAELLEVVTIIGDNGARSQAVLSHADIAATLNQQISSVPSASLTAVQLNRDQLIDALRRTRFGTAANPGKPEFAELFLTGSIVHHRYSIADLGARDAKTLLEKFFDSPRENTGQWWIRKSPARSEPVEENGLIALIRELGFEATRSQIAPVLFVRPPANFR